MGGSDYWVETFEEGPMDNFYMSLIGLVMVVVLIFFIWNCCASDEKQPKVVPAQQILPMKSAVFMHELEPGLVILQSQDGEFFRILQEYDAHKHHYVAPAPGACAGASCQGQEQPTINYIPHYTRPHYQTHPSAPPVAPLHHDLIDIDLGDNQTPPPYTE